MLRRLVNLPFTLATRVAKAYQDREDARTKERYAASDAHDASTAVRVGNGTDVVTIDPDTCRMDAADAVAAASGGRPVAFVDVRMTSPGGVAGALHMPLAECNVRVSELPPDTLTIVYCDDGADSARAVAFFRERGMDETWWIGGGLAAWTAAGGRVEAR